MAENTKDETIKNLKELLRQKSELIENMEGDVMIRNMFDDPEPKCKKTRKRPKYNTSTKKKDKPVYNGIIFDSLIELEYYRHLKQLQEKGEIDHIFRQAKSVLIKKYEIDGRKVRAAEIVVDFVIQYKDGRLEYHDTKGNPCEKAKLQRKLFESFYKVPLKWICYSKMDGGWLEYEELKKLRAKRKRTK